MEKTQGQPQKGFSVQSIPDRIRPDLLFFRTIILTPNYDPSVLNEHIKTRISRAGNPYVYVLDLVYYSPDCFRQYSQKFIYTVWNVFLEWLCSLSYREQLDLEIKKLALNMFLQMKNLSWIELPCEIFQFAEDCQELKSIIESHLAKDRLRQAACVIRALHLQPYFTLDQVAIPLFFSDFKEDLELYLEEYPDQQLELVKKLDTAVSSRSTIKEFMANSKVNISASHMGVKSDPKHMQKMLWKLLLKFNIPIEQCPNLWAIRSRGALNYLLYKRFTEQSMNDDAFKEMVLTSIKDIPCLHKELIIRLVCVNELDLALEMACTLNIDSREWPDTVLMHAKTVASRNSSKPSCSTSTDVVEPYWDDTAENNYVMEQYLTLRLSESDIHLVDTLDTFMDCIAVCEVYDVIGFDAEWRPSMGFYKSSKMSLLQLAVWDYVFLLDMLALTQCLDSSQWDQLTERLFANPEILKLGYGTQADLQLLKENCLGKNPVEFVRFLDFDPFFHHLSRTHPEVLKGLPFSKNDSDGSASSDKGLSGLCRSVLGKGLKKDEQFSDWERRPLRKAQITYAALDAYCLLQMYEELTKVLKKVNLDMDTVIYEYLHPKKVQAAKKSKDVSKQERQKVFQAQAEEFRMLNQKRPPLPMSQFKVVVDNMLSGLGKSLRMYGADVVILDDGEDHCKAVKIALKENRVLLTTGHVFLKFVDYLPPGMCFNSDTCIPVTEQIAAVCNYFNLLWTEDDIFTRCTLCNSNSYLNISSKDMTVLWNLYRTMPDRQEDANNLEPFIVCDGGFVTDACTIHTGVKMQMDGMMASKLGEHSTYYVCCQCGKIYWEGSHHRRAKERLQAFLEHDDVPKNAQEQSSTSNENEASTSKWNTGVQAQSSPVRSAHEKVSLGPAKSQNTADTNSKIYIAPEEMSSDDEDFMFFN